MKIIDNISHLPGEDIKTSVGRCDRLNVAAYCFSIFAFEARIVGYIEDDIIHGDPPCHAPRR